MKNAFRASKFSSGNEGILPFLLKRKKQNTYKTPYQPLQEPKSFIVSSTYIFGDLCVEKALEVQRNKMYFQFCALIFLYFFIS
jgi:hypothetical protein